MGKFVALILVTSLCGIKKIRNSLVDSILHLNLFSLFWSCLHNVPLVIIYVLLCPTFTPAAVTHHVVAVVDHHIAVIFQRILPRFKQAFTY